MTKTDSQSVPSGSTFGRDFVASLVVFLVALPLCMGIAIASGVPPGLGILTGVIGGMIVGMISGCSLGVSGPAAGLVVLTWQVVDQYGLAGLGPAVLITGLVQLAGAAAGAGRWFRATSPAVIHGMLGGIGVLIFASQAHVMVDDKPHGEGLENLATLPSAFLKGVWPMDGSPHQQAAALGVLTIVCLVIWETFKPKSLKAIPGALIGVLAATFAAMAMGAEITYISLPESLLDDVTFIWSADLSLFTDTAFLGLALTMAAIASAETLLCAAAVDRMHDGPRTKWDKELGSQGVGNALCGVLGALPMTGVIVRSSANVQAGGKTRWSSVMHGTWLLLLVVGLPAILRFIPQASLAAILVYTGYRLVDIHAMKHYWKTARAELAIYVTTMVGVVALDLLAGVIVGLAITAGRALWSLSRVQVTETDTGDSVQVTLAGAGTFLSIPVVGEKLEALPHDKPLRVRLYLSFLDHAFMEHVEEWAKGRKARGQQVDIDLDDLHKVFEGEGQVDAAEAKDTATRKAAGS